MDLIQVIAIAASAAGTGVAWFSQRSDRAEPRRQKEQDKIEKEKEKREQFTVIQGVCK